jgi:hypothetical protein
MSMVVAALLSAALTPEQLAAVKDHYSALGSTAIEAKPAAALPPDAKTERVDVSPQMRSASFGHKTTLFVELPAAGAMPKQYWVEYGKSTNHPAALYGPFALPAAH